MPIECRFLTAEKLVVFRHSGTVPDAEFLTSYRAYHEDSRFDKSYNLLVDLQRAQSSVRSPEALRTFAEFRRRWFAGTTQRQKVAVVAPQDLSFGLARMYEAYSEDGTAEFVVFRAVDAALAWLGVPTDVLDDPEESAVG